MEYDEREGSGAILWLLIALGLLIIVCVGVGGTVIVLSMLGG